MKTLPLNRRAEYESMSRGDLIDALLSADRTPSAETGRLLHELQVHQVELEVQNRQLREAQEALEESRSRYADLFDLAPVAYCIFDRNGTIEDANLAAASLLRANRSALIGLPFGRAVSLAAERVFADHVARCLSEQVRVTSELSVEVRGRGEVFLQMISTPILDPRTDSPHACRTMLADVTLMKRSQALFEFLSKTSEALAASIDVEETAKTTASVCVPMIADACFVDLCDPASADAPLRRASIATSPTTPPTTQDTLARHAADAAWQKHEQSLVKTATPVYEPAGAAALGATWESALGARSLVLIPLSGRERPLGVLGALMSTSTRAYSLQDFELARDIAHRSAMSLDNAFAYERLRTR